MTPQQLQAMKMALEALELNNSEWKDLADSGDSGYWKAEDQGHYQLTIEAITALEKALAQPEQEPVAWPCLIDSADFSENTITLVMQCDDYKVSAGTHWLSTTQPQRTEQEPVGTVKDLFTQAAWERLDVRGSTKVYLDTPSQRTWVGLTDEDMYVVSEEESCSFIAGAKWSEEILKEKNAICSPFMISELWRLNK